MSHILRCPHRPLVGALLECWFLINSVDSERVDIPSFVPAVNNNNRPGKRFWTMRVEPKKSLERPLRPGASHPQRHENTHAV